MKFQRIIIPKPKTGASGWLLDRKGGFILHEGFVVFRGLACTHAGSGTLEIIDGIPDEHGFFPDSDILGDIRHPRYGCANGRVIYKSPASVMGMWTLNVGLHHGLCVFASGPSDSVGTVATFIWEGFTSTPVTTMVPDDGS